MDERITKIVDDIRKHLKSDSKYGKSIQKVDLDEVRPGELEINVIADLEDTIDRRDLGSVLNKFSLLYSSPKIIFHQYTPRQYDDMKYRK